MFLLLGPGAWIHCRVITLAKKMLKGSNLCLSSQGQKICKVDYSGSVYHSANLSWINNGFLWMWFAWKSFGIESQSYKYKGNQGNPVQTPHEQIKKRVLCTSRTSQPLRGFPDDPSTERPSVWSPVTEVQGTAKRILGSAALHHGNWRAWNVFQSCMMRNPSCYLSWSCESSRDKNPSLKDILLLVKHQLVHSGILHRHQLSAIFSQTKLRRWRRGFERSIGRCPRLPLTEFGECSAAQKQKRQDTKMSKNIRVAFSLFRNVQDMH